MIRWVYYYCYALNTGRILMRKNGQGRIPDDSNSVCHRTRANLQSIKAHSHFGELKKLWRIRTFKSLVSIRIRFVGQSFIEDSFALLLHRYILKRSACCDWMALVLGKKLVSNLNVSGTGMRALYSKYLLMELAKNAIKAVSLSFCGWHRRINCANPEKQIFLQQHCFE